MSFYPITGPHMGLQWACPKWRALILRRVSLLWTCTLSPASLPIQPTLGVRMDRLFAILESQVQVRWLTYRSWSTNPRTLTRMPQLGSRNCTELPAQGSYKSYMSMWGCPFCVSSCLRMFVQAVATPTKFLYCAFRKYGSETATRWKQKQAYIKYA